jgi:hypothetical protein
MQREELLSRMNDLRLATIVLSGSSKETIILAILSPP